MGVKLSLATLDRLPAGIAAPSYARSEISPGILHLGIGNFHRAHQAVYLDDLFNAGLDRDFGVVGAGIRPHDAAMRKQLAAQDWLSTVVELEPGANRARVTGSMVDFVPVAGDGRAIIERLADPSIRIASLTVTEGGYCIDSATGRFDPEHADIRYDAAHLSAPRGVFGVLLAGLKRRRDAGHPPFTVMSCDNIPGNGHAAREAVAGLAEHVDPGFASYVRTEVAFPDSMVDRITPATTDRERRLLQERFGLSDNWPVFCEPYRQWVLEDRFSAGRPRLEEVGVTFIRDVAPYELMKIRILNGGHAAIAYPAGLLGIHFVHDAMAHPLVRGFLDRLEREEIIPGVASVPNVDLDQYYAVIASRFSNPEIGDTIPRLCQDGSNRQPKFILPSTRDRLRQGGGVAGLALVSALWCRYCAGTTEDGETIELDDPNAATLQSAALAAREDPNAFLNLRPVFGDLATSEAFCGTFAAHLRTLWSDGVEASLRSYLN